MTTTEIKFTDPVNRLLCELIVPADEAAVVGIRHSGCSQLADVSVDLDAFYCTACKVNGRVSGAWVANQVQKTRQTAQQVLADARAREQAARITAHKPGMLYVVVVGTHEPYRACAALGLFDDPATAHAFADFITAEVDPAQVLLLSDPVAELLSWRDHVLNPKNRIMP